MQIISRIIYAVAAAIAAFAIGLVAAPFIAGAWACRWIELHAVHGGDHDARDKARWRNS